MIIFAFGGILSFLASLPSKHPPKKPKTRAAAMELEKNCCIEGTQPTVQVYFSLSVGSRVYTPAPAPGKCFRGEMDEKFIGNIVYVSSVVCYNPNLYIAIKFPRLSVLTLHCPV